VGAGIWHGGSGYENHRGMQKATFEKTREYTISAEAGEIDMQFQKSMGNSRRQSLTTRPPKFRGALDNVLD
jgi:hypothetical protein